jgi:two-component system, NtrC family, sensor histidine kinase HydH
MAAQLSKLHNLEDELRKRDRMTALGEAAMVIAHEVRNPLGIIKTSAEVVRKRAHLGASEERLLGYVVDEVRRIERLIKDFLDFARPKTPIKHPVKLRVLVDRVAALARVEAQKHHVDLQVIEVKEHVEILGDIDQLHQALLNLMLNALDAMPDSGTLKITIDSNQTDASISVSDTGAGIAPDIIDKVFDPFFTTKAKGTGLGLAKVQHVAEAHGGKASCTSIQEQGAMFTISLPKLAPSAIYKNEAL